MLVLGVSIEESSVYTVLMKPVQKGDPQLVEYRRYPLSLDHEAEEQKKLELSSVLKKLCRQYPPQYHHYIFTIPQKKITIHDLKFPFREKFRINKALPYEISHQLPLSLDQIIYSSKISFQSKDDSHILTFITEKKWIHDFLNFLKSEKIQPFILTPKSIALANLFEDWKSAPLQLETKAEVDQIKIFLGYQNSIALLLSQNRVIYIYDIHWGIKSCVQDIAKKYRRTMDQALDYFYKNAFIKKENSPDLSHFVPLSKIINRSFSSLTKHLRLLLIHLESSGFSSIKEVALFGPGSQIQNLTYHLFNIFKIPVKRIEQYDSLPIEYLPALGSAFEGFKRPKNPSVNFIQNFKSSSEEMIKISNQRKRFLKTAGLIFAFFLSYSMVRNWYSARLEERTSRSFSMHSRKIAKLGTRDISVKNVRNFLNAKNRIQKKYKLLQDLPHISTVMENLNLISQSLSQPDIWKLELTQLDIDGAHVILSGFIHPDYLKTLKTNLQSIAVNNKIKDDSKNKIHQPDHAAHSKDPSLELAKTADPQIPRPSLSQELSPSSDIQQKENSYEGLVFFYLTFKMES